MHKLVLIRHGESLWNRDQRFTGWVDIDITERGARQAQQAATLLKEAGYSFDMAFTSVLKRAIRSQWIIADELDLMWIPQISHWRLNEKHYGALTGLSKTAAAIQYGQEQVLLWRRSYDTRAPALEREDPRSSRYDPRYAQLDPAQIPLTESLEDTVLRILPLWNESIAPAIMAGKRVIITAHGNSI
jgi:2,3-bisphosphoglycerate-dependent phosphoglycerate mutase